MAAQYNVKPKSAIDYFKYHKFDGNKVMFPPFSDEVLTNLYLKIGQDRSRILTTNWQINPETGIPIVGEEFQIINVPQNLSLPGATILQEAVGSRGQPTRRLPTADEKAERKAEIEAITSHNEMNGVMYRACSKILSSRVSASLNNKLLEFRGNPVRFWHYLKSTYGADMLVGQNLGLEFLRVIAMQMKHGERFNEFLLDFQRRSDIVHFTNDMRVGMILSDGTVGIRRVLPQRLEKARELCEVNNHDYAMSCQIIMSLDDRQHEAGLPPEDPGNINVVKKTIHKKTKNTDELSEEQQKGLLLCYNCQNYCHTAPYCKLNACGYCNKFNVGHKSHDCPQRSSKEGETKAAKTPRKKRNAKTKVPAKKPISFKAKAAAEARHAPSESEDSFDDEESSSSSSEGEDDEVLPKGVKGKIMSIMHAAYGGELGSDEEMECPIEFLNDDA